MDEATVKNHYCKITKFKPEQKVIDELANYNDRESDIRRAANELVVYCMYNDDKPTTPVSIRDSLAYIYAQLIYISDLVTETTKNIVFNNYSINNEVCISERDYDLIFDGKNADDAAERLALLKHTANISDYFGEGDKYEDKLMQVKEWVKGFINYVYSSNIHSLSSLFSEYEVKDDIEKGESKVNYIYKENCSCCDSECFNCESRTFCPTSATGEQNDRS